MTTTTPTAASPRPALGRWLLAGGVVVAWVVAFSMVGSFTWGYGRQTFTLMLGMAALLLALFRARPWAVPPPARAVRWLRLAALLLFSQVLILSAVEAVPHFRLRYQADGTPVMRRVIDMPTITLEACRLWNAGHNPYSAGAQTLYDVRGHYGVTTDASGQIYMFGVPYKRGYCYFPVMFLAYWPAWLAWPDARAIRWTNLLLQGLNLWLILWLCALHTRGGTGRGERFGSTGLLAVTLSLALPNLRYYDSVWITEVFNLGTIDILLSTLTLGGMVALQRGRPATAGVLFGLCQGAKLLPGPLCFVAGLCWWWSDRPARRRYLAAWVAVVAVALLPFILRDPPAFLSATVLYYLTFHHGGNDSSMWFTLPPAWRGPFTLLGLAVQAGVLAWLQLRRRRDPLTPLLTVFVCYLIFIAFNFMTHLNYLWGIWPLGCVALAVLVRRNLERKENRESTRIKTNEMP